MDPLAVHLAMTEAVAHMRAGNGPTLVEADIYRYFHQNGAFAGQRLRLPHQGGGARVARARPARAAPPTT